MSLDLGETPEAPEALDPLDLFPMSLDLGETQEPPDLLEGTAQIW
jgi:hypothetical protein